MAQSGIKPWYSVKVVKEGDEWAGLVGFVTGVTEAAKKADPDMIRVKLEAVGKERELPETDLLVVSAA